MRNAEGGEGVDATQVVDDLIEIREQSMAGTTFVLGHELAHNLLDVMRRTGTLTPEREAALRERFATKDGAFDEEAFADAFGDRLRRAFVVGQRELAETPDNAVVRLLDALAGWVARIVEAVRRTRGGAVRTPTDAAGAVDALVRETPVGQEVEDGMRRSGVPVDEMKDVGGEQDGESERTNRTDGTDGENNGGKQDGGQQGTVPPSENVERDDARPVPLRADRRRELLTKIAQRRGRKFSTEEVGDDVLDAMDTLARGEDAMLHSEALGEVLYPFGKTGKGGMGFLHIVERRMAQGHTLDEAVEIALRVGESAARGTETVPVDRKMYNTKWFDKNGYRAIIATGGDTIPIITGYDIQEDIEERDASGAHRRPEGYAPNPHVSSDEVVAALKKIVANNRAARQGRSFSTEAVSPEEDAAYLKAVAEGDMENAGRMVEDAARKAGYTTRAYHGTGQFGFTVFDPEKSDDGISLFFAGDTGTAESYSGVSGVREIGRGDKYSRIAKELEDVGDWEEVVSAFDRVEGFHSNHVEEEDGEEYYELIDDDTKEVVANVPMSLIVDRVDASMEFSDLSLKDIRNGLGEKAAGNYGVGLRFDNPLVFDAQNSRWDRLGFKDDEGNTAQTTRQLADYAKRNGYDGVIIRNVHDVGAVAPNLAYDYDTVYVAFSPEQVKSLDPVTYDDAGGVVPLSERFDADRQDVRWSTEAVGGGPHFSETEAGRRVVARLVDNLIRHQEDLAFGNAAVEGALEQGGNATVGKWNRVASAGANGAESLPDTAEGLAKEEKFRAFQFGRPGGEELRELVREAGSAENWLDVVGTAYEALSAVRAGNLLGGGLAEQIAKRYERSEREAVGWYVRRIVEARATDYGQKCYLMGREFAMQLMREANESALAELRSEYEDKLSAVRAERREADEARRTAERGRDRARERLRLERARQRFIDADRDLLTRWLLAEAQNEVRATRERERAKAAEAVGEAKAQTREAKKAATAERNRAEAAERALARERETSANVAWQLAEERLLSRYYEAKMKHMMEMKVRTLRDRMRETREQQALKDARKRALERERGMSFAELQGVLGFDLMARVEQAALSEDDVGTLAERIVREIDAGFDKETQQGRKELWEWGTYTGAAVPLRLTKQGERAYAMTAQHILKGLARRLAYGRKRVVA